MKVELRPARAQDAEITFCWANDPDTRSASFHSSRIERTEHERWLLGSLGNPRRALWIAEVDGEAIGLVRLDLSGPACAEVGIALAPERRGQGLAVPTLQATCEHATTSGIERLIARIRPANERSRRSFERVGFRYVGAENVAGQEALRYERAASLELDEP